MFVITDESRLRDFPSLAEKTYLNTAAEGIPPRSVLDALHQYATDIELGYDGRARHDVQWSQAKAQVAGAYGLTPDEVTICSCSSEAYNMAAMALHLQAGDEVVINDLDFPAGATPWLSPTCPATVKVWRHRVGKLHVDDLVPLLSTRTRLVTTSLVSFLNGFRVSLKPMVEMIRKNSSALIAVDVTQALGRIPLQLDDVDLIISSTHKWILASHGGGLVAIPADKAEAWTTHAGGWFNQQNAFDADRFERAINKPGAGSFTPGMPNYPAVYAINAGLNYITSVGVSAIDAHCRPLVDACYDGLRKMPVQMMTSDNPDERAGIIAFQYPDAESVFQKLHAQNIHMHHHAGRLRVAIHGYNTAADIDKFLKAIHALIAS